MMRRPLLLFALHNPCRRRRTLWFAVFLLWITMSGVCLWQEQPAASCFALAAAVEENNNNNNNKNGEPQITSGGSAPRTVETASSVSSTAAAVVAQQQHHSQLSDPPLPSGPFELTSRNFDNLVAGGIVGAWRRYILQRPRQIWLVEFYSTACVHCTEFSQTYEAVAKHYHTSPITKDLNIRVGRVNGEDERALVTRFDLYAYPTFFLLDGSSVYQFNEKRTPRSKKALQQFVEGGYKKTGTIVPFYESPMGPMGLIQGSLVTAGLGMMDLMEWMQTQWGLSPLITAGMVLFAMFLGCFAMIVTVAIWATPKVKRD